MTSTLRDRSDRAALIRHATADMGWLLDDTNSRSFSASSDTPAAKASSVQSILNTALTAEQIAVTFYYTGLTSRAVMNDNRLSGKSSDPNNPGLPPGGSPANVADMQACLDAEVKHAAALKPLASSPYTKFYFPAGAFSSLGSTAPASGFLAVMDALETAFVGAYIAAVNQFLQLGRPDLAGIIAQIMGVEAEHRVLARVIANVDPANNLTLQKAPYTTVAQAAAALGPFVTGKGHVGGSTLAIALPSSAQTTRVVGRYGTHIVSKFL